MRMVLLLEDIENACLKYEIGPFESTEQRVCDQARAIRKNGWLSEIEIELLKREMEIEDCMDVTEIESIVENEDTTGDVESVYPSMQQRDGQ